MLGLYDFENDQFSWVDLTETNKNILGIDGICSANNRYYLISQLKPGGISGLVVLNANLKVENNYQLVHSNDVHSIISYENGFLIADTGTNRINKILINKDVIVEDEFWRYDSEGKDTVHLNSITKLNNQIIAAMFGNKPKEGWQNVKSGKIIEVTTNSVICDNLFHPHSLITINDTLYWLESKTGSVHKYSEKNGHEIIMNFDGYLRGFAYDEKYFYVGASAKRRKSRSTGVLNDSISINPQDSHSWIYRINRNDLQYEKKMLTCYGSEIYDLFTLSKKYFIDNTQAIAKRIWHYEDEYLNLKEKNSKIDIAFKMIIREYVQNREWEKALSHIERILDTSIDAELEYMLAFILQMKNENLERSLKYYDLALKHGFDEFWIVYNRGQLYLTLGKRDLAMQDLERALFLKPEDEHVIKILNNLKNN